MEGCRSKVEGYTRGRIGEGCIDMRNGIEMDVSHIKWVIMLFSGANYLHYEAMRRIEIHAVTVVFFLPPVLNFVHHSHLFVQLYGRFLLWRHGRQRMGVEDVIEAGLAKRG